MLLKLFSLAFFQIQCIPSYDLHFKEFGFTFSCYTQLHGLADSLGGMSNVNSLVYSVSSYPAPPLSSTFSNTISLSLFLVQERGVS